MVSDVNFLLSHITKIKRTVAIAEPVILDFLLLQISNVFTKKSFILLQKAEAFSLTFEMSILIILSNKTKLFYRFRLILKQILTNLLYHFL